ncbi:parathyroid hormone 4-like [Calypte anna]|uniref:parathyroid hormone 4-like n=1 Tax=Calypte anna TaxID=9244 RepID=UPI0011C4463A|nr:parathyroid hormone 4-like [Calypte anna]
MFLPSRSLQMVTLMAILLACSAACQDPENKRAVTEHQLMHDKGREFQGLKRLMWLHNALGSVHTASSRDVSLSDAMWDSQKSQDPSDLYNSIGRAETPSLEVPGKEQSFPLLNQPRNVKTPKGNWKPQNLPDLLQIKVLGSRRNPSSQLQNSSC